MREHEVAGNTGSADQQGLASVAMDRRVQAHVAVHGRADEPYLPLDPPGALEVAGDLNAVQEHGRAGEWLVPMAPHLDAGPREPERTCYVGVGHPDRPRGLELPTQLDVATGT
ncbi:hypothetical protein [Amycolatopsis arida]|uniref:hypothetical protein n=1 Tax=Amycolatopsis arida TaxID=587909 RepID=UPI000B82B4AA|nr:hypothetical protein [Amycolatopsis arida]